MTLLEKQQLFAKEAAVLIIKAFSLGYGVTFGETWRSPETTALYAKQGKGISNSLHIKRLAIDLNLFKEGKFLTDSKNYETLGVYWESRSTKDIKFCWGGRFKDAKGKPKPDGNHFSISDGGIK